jgi:hypothetical protein
LQTEKSLRLFTFQKEILITRRCHAEANNAPTFGNGRIEYLIACAWPDRFVLPLDAVDLANAYSQAGDSSSAQAVLQMAANLGQGYATPSPGESEISQLVGIFIERKALQAMNPNNPYGNSSQTVQDQLNELAQQRASVKELDQQVSNLLPEMSNQDWIIYHNRWLMFGEENAQSWVVNKYGQR